MWKAWFASSKSFSRIPVRERGKFGDSSVMVWEGISLHTKNPNGPHSPKSQRYEVLEYYFSAGGDFTHYKKSSNGPNT